MKDYTPPPCPQSTNRAEKHNEVGRKEGGRKEGGRKGGRERGEEGGRKGGREEGGTEEGGRDRGRRKGRKRKEESYHHLLSSSGVVQGTPALEHVHHKLVPCQFYCVYGCDYQWVPAWRHFRRVEERVGLWVRGEKGGGI